MSHSDWRIDDYRTILTDGRPLMDVRAAIEFNQGAFPTATNLPLINDDERHKIGLCYKQHGQDAAIAMGQRLVSGEIKQQRLNQWSDFIDKHPDGALYCFRGGLRSQTTQQWIKTELGVDYPLVAGGYKALRRHLLDSLQPALARCQLIIVGGLTGSGKTEFIHEISNSLDLELHARHRGSAFGGTLHRQPAQIDFENALIIDLLKIVNFESDGRQALFLEDESRAIGSVSIPLELYQAMQSAPLVWLEDSFESRVARIEQEYIIEAHRTYRQQFGDYGDSHFGKNLRASVNRLQKRLGNTRYSEIMALLEAALALQTNTGQTHLHRSWISRLLKEYYDPMYYYQKEKFARKLIATGSHKDLMMWLRTTR